MNKSRQYSIKAQRGQMLAQKNLDTYQNKLKKRFLFFLEIFVF